MNNRTISFALIATILISTALANRGDNIPFDPVRGLVEVPVVIDGRVKGSFGIDTGADRFYIDSSFAHKNGLMFASGPPQRKIVGVEGSSSASTVDLRSLRIGNESLYNLSATAIDLTQIIKDQRYGMPDGLIGYDLLRRFYVTVDYPNQTISLSSSPSLLTDDSGSPLPYVRFHTERHMIVIDVTFDDSLTVPMALDYCASYTTLSPEFASQLELSDKGNGVSMVNAMSIDNLPPMKNVAVLVRDMSAFTSSVRGSFEGILGASFLIRYKLTIDYKAERVYFHE